MSTKTRTKLSRRGILLATLAAGAVGVAPLTSSFAEEAGGKTKADPTETVVEGTAHFSYRPFPQDKFKLTVNARGNVKGAKGTFTGWHTPPGEPQDGGIQGTIDCVLPGGRGNVTMTGVVTKTPPGEASALIGHRVGLSISTHRGGRVGFSWGVDLEAPVVDVPKCNGPAPFAPVVAGRHRISGNTEYPAF
ncbi:hypothetical protein [Spirillospora sp. CA-294931]|uniref:hypothetical protein n=1 Tax=Spirillospora sp. CA-294931 TaxID=3240042 RepID=UPI003D92CE7C